MGCRIVKEKGFAAIMCGSKKDHACNSKKSVYSFSDGSTCSLFDKAKEQKLNLNMCNDDILYFLEQKFIHVTGWSSQCSICGNIPMLDDFYRF